MTAKTEITDMELGKATLLARVEGPADLLQTQALSAAPQPSPAPSMGFGIR